MNVVQSYLIIFNVVSQSIKICVKSELEEIEFLSAVSAVSSQYPSQISPAQLYYFDCKIVSGIMNDFQFI